MPPASKLQHTLFRRQYPRPSPLNPTASGVDSIFFRVLTAPHRPENLARSRQPTPKLSSTELSTVGNGRTPLTALVVDDSGSEACDDSDSEGDEDENALLEGVDPAVFSEQIWTPNKDWAWLNNISISNTMCHAALANNDRYKSWLATSIVEEFRYPYIRKRWPLTAKSKAALVEVALYKKQLNSLQGIGVPALMNVYTSLGELMFMFEPVHTSFWIGSSPKMPAVLKKRCVEAFQRLHARGVLHGDVKLSNIVINGDAEVFIMNFEKGRAIETHGGILERATPTELQIEMRKVKFLLDYQNARRKEAESVSEDDTASSDFSVSNPVETSDNQLTLDDFRSFLEGLSEAHQPPQRVVIPGQSPEEVKSKVRRLLGIIAAMELEDNAESSSSLPPPPPPPNDPRPTTPVRDLGNQRHRYHLRKRKDSSDHLDIPAKPTKRRRISTGAPPVPHPVLIDNSGGIVPSAINENSEDIKGREDRKPPATSTNETVTKNTLDLAVPRDGAQPMIGDDISRNIQQNRKRGRADIEDELENCYSSPASAEGSMSAKKLKTSSTEAAETIEQSPSAGKFWLPIILDYPARQVKTALGFGRSSSQRMGRWRPGKSPTDTSEMRSTRPAGMSRRGSVDGWGVIRGTRGEMGMGEPFKGPLEVVTRWMDGFWRLVG